MYVEELIIDGFKSYATRTVISGWDSEFNAITGLNGSGKSNILDAICFVLGISNLSQVRAANLQDLVYKRGQAGITKASVTIVFNNEDRAKSPVGYEDHKQITITRQIVIGGKNKWIVNGHNAQQQVVANLYQSVQLNVNNPHFLIMQGRITKVLNMKPPEVLAMIEEASGTRMFEERKDKAIKTMAKKDKKLEEINQLLDEEIVPKLDKLREEKRTYLEFQKINVELDHITRLLVAFEYKRCDDKLQHSGQELQAKKDRMTELDKLCETLNAELQAMEARQAEIAAELTKNGKGMAGKDEEIKELSKAMVRCRTQSDLQATLIADEQKSLAQLIENKTENEGALQTAEKKHEKIKMKYDPLKADHDSKVTYLNQQEGLLQTLITGMSAGGKNEAGYAFQLQESKTEMSNATSDVDQTKLKIAQLQKDVKEMKPKAQKAASENQSLVKSLATTKEAIATIEADIQRLNVDHERQAVLIQDKKHLADKMSGLKEQIDRISQELSNVMFEYQDPTPNFDRKTVKGMVMELISISENDREWSVAVETCAGGNLQSVIVDTEHIGKLILDHGKSRPVTCLPLNKVIGRNLDPQRLAAAKKIAPSVIPAINLVHFDDYLENLMLTIFGTTLVCEDKKTAEAVTYNKALKIRSVTKDGDTYDPSGTLSGGSKAANSGILLKMQTLQELKQQQKELQTKLDAVNKDMDASTKIVAAYNALVQKKALKSHEMTLLDEQASTNSHAQIIKQVSDIEDQIIESQKALETHTARIKTASDKCKFIEKEMDELVNNRDGKLKAIEAEIKKAKASIAECVGSVKALDLQIQVAVQEIAQLKTEIATQEEQITAMKKSIQDNTTKHETMREQLAAAKASYEEANAKAEEERKHLAEFDTESRKLEADRKSHDKKVNAANLERQTLSHELDRGVADREHASRAIQALLKEHTWIPDHKHTFGEKGTPYEFTDETVSEAKKRKKQLEDRNDHLRHNINPQVIDMLDRMEKRETSLKQMLATVKKDKTKIEDTIASLDEYKREALQKTWEKVNGDFGSIFGELLSGNSAKLEPPEGADITDGLEIKVRLGTVWKQSLTELSGGQRSLIALSLILSLLQFKPAPMYILDEVDAALDLSHTQNIGHLLRTRFKGSQFIVVSLKDGMFNNANVLFKAKFREGVSTVERHAQRSSNGGSGAASVQKAVPMSTGGKRKASAVRRADVGVVGRT
ncbi:hypothetical protein SmJEL517_g04864 [Synchytrium microbalum]|uniref:Structural maintenance of chromosomes protein n=1 Tax=Synchytrium microbalum TaxID=1806994 RepID=A0A507C327_9FUNG|nr:uncharacterized protein SmJEL517_g04864 [Synchytrium microbalum]TPX31945.1 hypothetical protein SmJEL517_g04864 [Synchytrium microbalum]